MSTSGSTGWDRRWWMRSRRARQWNRWRGISILVVAAAGSVSVDPAMSRLRSGLSDGGDAGEGAVLLCRAARRGGGHPAVGRSDGVPEERDERGPRIVRTLALGAARRARARDRAPPADHRASRQGSEVGPRAAAKCGRRDSRRTSRSMVTLQQLIFKLSEFWASRGCLLQQPLDIEMGAGTMHPETFLRVLGPEPWSVAYVQPSRRPADGRFGENPNRLFKHQQFQVILKPAPGRRAAALSAEPGGLRHRPARPRRALRRGQLGVADPRRLGHRLAGAVRRPGDHAVHLFPAGRRRRSVADLRRAHLRHRAIRHGAAGRGRRLRPGVGARA